MKVGLLYFCGTMALQLAVFYGVHWLGWKYMAWRDTRDAER